MRAFCDAAEDRGKILKQSSLDYTKSLCMEPEEKDRHLLLYHTEIITRD